MPDKQVSVTLNKELRDQLAADLIQMRTSGLCEMGKVCELCDCFADQDGGRSRDDSATMDADVVMQLLERRGEPVAWRHSRWFDPHPPDPDPSSIKVRSGGALQASATCRTCNEVLYRSATLTGGTVDEEPGVGHHPDPVPQPPDPVLDGEHLSQAD